MSQKAVKSENLTVKPDKETGDQNSSAMKFLFHTQYYPPEVGAPQARLSELAAGLNEKGFNVSVLTAMPNYPKGRIFDGYKGLRKKEVLNDIPVTRTWIYPTQKPSLIPRLVNYFSFVFSSLFLGAWGIGKIDYLLTESPPLFLGITGYFISRLKRAKWIFNVSDLWPESVLRLGAIKPGFALNLSKRLEAFFYKKAWLVTGQSKDIIKDINHRFPTVKTYHLSNGVDTHLFSPDKFDPQVRKELSPNGEMVVFYGGLHGIAQGLDQVLLVARSFNEKVRFVFMGDGPEKQRLIRMAEELQIPNIIFLAPQPREKMPAYVASADICIIPLRMILPGAVPSKIYEAMASAKPVVLVAEGEAKQIVQNSNAGIVLTPGDIDGITDAIDLLNKDIALRSELGKNGRNAVTTYFSRRRIIEDFSHYLLTHLN